MEDLNSLTLSELLELRADLGSRIQNICTQLSTRKEEAPETGAPGHSEYIAWRKSALYAKQFVERDIAAVKERIRAMSMELNRSPDAKPVERYLACATDVARALNRVYGAVVRWRAGDTEDEDAMFEIADALGFDVLEGGDDDG